MTCKVNDSDVVYVQNDNKNVSNLHISLMKRETTSEIYRIAEDQAGYFSLRQAVSLGITRGQIYRGIKQGVFQKAGWGVYRFVQFPASRFEEIHAAVLEAGEHAVVGFQTALYVYDLSDLIPDEIHLILPATSSRRRPGIKVHTTHLDAKDIHFYEGLPITSVARTIVDCAFSFLELDQIRLACRQALHRGIATSFELMEEARRKPARVQEIIRSILEKVT